MLARSPSLSSPDVVIIGAGVIGLSLGLALAEAGAGVTILERDEAGQGASRAAAGMLAAGIEAEPGEAALLRLNLRSQALWPAYAQALADRTGLDVGLRGEGTLAVALTRDDTARLRHTRDWQAKAGVSADWLDGEALRDKEPALNPRAVAALYMAADGQVDNRRLTMALLQAFRAAGGTLREQAPVARIVVERGRATGVVLDGETIPAGTVVLAAGAWSREIGGVPETALPPVRPVKGQMLSLAMDPARPLLRHVVWSPTVYLVPRADGTLIVGGTVEEKGFDLSLTAGGQLALLEGAWRVLPGVEELAIVEQWVGFRPGSRDDAPVLGRCAVDGLILATGHHRNGILLTPVTAALLADLILESREDSDLAAVSIARFHTAPMAAAKEPVHAFDHA